ncbi:MAG TPA: hypothetical protein VHZ55_06135 [Bryobacteraceae bacterium]|nr:hypothetical protein [Bryobacteraceae bacterium]
MQLRPTANFPAASRIVLSELETRLPVLQGEAIRVDLKPQLTAYRGKLLSGRPGIGSAVHAATFIRSRRIVLEKELLASFDGFRSIIIHELFHFVWVRLGNPARQSFSRLLVEEWLARARGELGESAAVRKSILMRKPNRELGNRPWREYVCESFCDTAAWFYLPELTDPYRNLAIRWRERRKRWFSANLAGTLLC